MISYIISDKQIHLLAALSVENPHERFKIVEEHGTRIMLNADTLLAANYVGVNARYKESGSEKIKWPNKLWSSPDIFDYWKLILYCRELSKEYTLVQKLKLCQNYEYQCCDADSWRGSDAKQLLGNIISKLIMEMPDYNEAPWGIE
jgi:hypothetical protein